MLEFDLISGIRQELLFFLDKFYSINDVEILKAYQKTKTNISNQKVIYFYKISDTPRAFTLNNYFFLESENKHYQKQTQIVDVNIQFEAKTKNDNSSDLLHKVLLIFQNYFFHEALKQKNISMIRLSGIRNNFIKDFDDNNLEVPSFDGTFAYEKELIFEIENIDNIKNNTIERI